MWYVIGWLFIGLATGGGMVYHRWEEGEDVTLNDAGMILLCTVCGLLTAILLVAALFDDNRYTVLIRGKGNDGES